MVLSCVRKTLKFINWTQNKLTDFLGNLPGSGILFQNVISAPIVVTVKPFSILLQLAP